MQLIVVFGIISLLMVGTIGFFTFHKNNVSKSDL